MKNKEKLIQMIVGVLKFQRIWQNSFAPGNLAVAAMEIDHE
jgi:hypothetical protein